MNNMPWTFPHTPYPMINIVEELNKLRQEINNINERLTKLETKQKSNYLQKDDTLHMM